LDLEDLVFQNTAEEEVPNHPHRSHEEFPVDHPRDGIPAVGSGVIVDVIGAQVSWQQPWLHDLE